MSHSFYEVALAWRKEKMPLLRQSTMCNYLLLLNKHLLPHFGSAPAISENDVQRFILLELEEGLARKTVRDHVALLKMICKHGRKRQLFGYTDWELHYPSPDVPPRPRTLSLKDHRTLLRYLTEHPSPRTVGVLLALSTGMRIGEVCALKWSDVDFHSKVISIRQTAGRVYNCELRTTQKICGLPKTPCSRREIPMTTLLARILKQVRRESRHDYVVGNLPEGQEPRAYRDYFNRLLRRLELPRITFHGLRHSFATRCVENGCDIKTLSALLGHSNVATTLNLYVHPDFGQKKRCVDKLTRYLLRTGAEEDWA